MSDIQKAEYNISPSLTADERELYLFSLKPKLKTLTQKDIKVALAEIIPRAVFDAGQTIDELKLVGIINSILPDLKYFSTLSIEDVNQALRLGVRGEYGEYMGINPVSIIGFLKGYTYSEKRATAKRKQDEYIQSLNRKPEISEEDKINIMKKGVVDAFETIKSGAFYNDIGNSIYTYLDRNGFINFSVERKKQILERAKERSRINLLDKFRDSRSGFEKTDIREKLKSISIGSTDVPEVIIEAKKIALNDYFKDLIEIGEDINNIFVDK